MQLLCMCGCRRREGPSQLSKSSFQTKFFILKFYSKSHPSQVPVMEGEEGSRSRSKFARLVNKDGVINITYRTLLWSNPLTRIFEGSVRAYSSSFWLACKH